MTTSMTTQIVATDLGVYIEMRRVLTADERAQIERARVEVSIGYEVDQYHDAHEHQVQPRLRGRRGLAICDDAAFERAPIESIAIKPRAVGPTWIHPAEIVAALGNRSRGLLTNPLAGGGR